MGLSDGENQGHKNLKEGDILKLIIVEASKHGCILFRNNRGMFRTVDGKRLVRAGIEFAGSSDLIGIYKGRFVAIEVKRPTKKPTEEQNRFIEIIRKNGGIAGVCDDPKKIKNILDA